MSQRTLTATDRSTLLKLARSLPKGDETRRAVLAGLKEAGASDVPQKKWDQMDTAARVKFLKTDPDMYPMGEHLPLVDRMSKLDWKDLTPLQKAGLSESKALRK